MIIVIINVKTDMLLYLFYFYLMETMIFFFRIFLLNIVDNI